MRWSLLAALTACYSPAALDSRCARCTGEVACLHGDMCIDGRCQQIAGQCDGDLDAGIDADPNPLCFGVEQRPFFEMCLPANLMLLPGASLTNPMNTDTDCTYVDPASAQRQKAEFCVIAADTIILDSDVRFIGSRPIVLFARTRFEIKNMATLDVAGHATDAVAQAAAGANLTTCAALDGTDGSTPNAAGGGAPGGSFQTRGGDGSLNGTNMLNAAGPPIGTPGLRGGCRGGRGGKDPAGVAGGGSGGPSGGAVYVLAPMIAIDGTINASGGGARTQAELRSGGGGGGSGGMIVLWAKQPIFATAPSRIFALGGGGGSGGDTAALGSRGDDPDSPTSPAAFTPSQGGPGAGGGGTVAGNGFAGTTGTNSGGGGGGGGGVGYIKTIPATSGPQFAPPPTN